VTGTWTANADGTYTDDTTTSGNVQFSLAKACLVISSTPTTCEKIGSIFEALGYPSTCTSAADGGCTCYGTVHQSGGLGLASGAPSTSGNYKTSSNEITLTDSGDVKYSFCASGDKLTVTPQSMGATLTGTIVLQKDNTSGAGGGGGEGGSGGAGGASGSGGSSGSGGASGAGGAGGGNPTGMGPCDIYKSGGTPCVAAHSTIRALFGAYAGKLYQVRNMAGATKDINAISPGSVADAATQDTFCMGTSCVFTVIYDQTGSGNDLWYESQGSPVGGMDQPAPATKESIMLGGKKVYSLYMDPGHAYWEDGSTKGMPLGAAPQGIYMVTSGTHVNGGCCFDYGNGETSRKYVPGPSMDAISFSKITTWGTGAGSGPWVMADLEGGIYGQGAGGNNPNVPSMTQPFVTAIEKNNGTTEFALRGADATSGNLSTFYKGKLPPGYNPMKKQGALVLGSGGDCCATNTNLSAGTFYEGCIVSGYPSDATEDALQANIVAARYGK